LEDSRGFCIFVKAGERNLPLLLTLKVPVMEVQVQRYLRRKVAADPNSPLVYHLRQVRGTSETYTLESLAQSIEKSSSLTAEDVVHAVHALAREMKQVFRGGNRVKIDGLGIFSLTFNATEVETEKECNVKTIKKVNIRFRADKALRLENESTALVRAGHGVKFAVADERTRKKAERKAAEHIAAPQATVAPQRPCVEKKPEKTGDGRQLTPKVNREKNVWSYGKPALILQNYLKRRKDEYARNHFEGRKELAGP
jgi:predicted histone-like DNA-binding protein